MGANAQTSVPLFVANSVLTAAQQNISAATGVPVFATTVTRDAAFGGSNKALAEGQLAYIEASNIVQYYDGAAWATVGPTTPSGVVQVKSTTVTASTFSTSSATLVDITGMSVSITPTSASNKVFVLFAASHGGTVNNIQYFQLLRDATQIGVGSEGTAINSPFNTSRPLNTSMIFLDSPATTSAITYKLQVKTNANTFYLNRRGDSNDVGGISTITVMEVTP